MSNITRDDLERIIERIKKSENKKKAIWIGGFVAAILVVAAAVLLYKKLTPDPDEFEDDLDDDEFLDVMEVPLVDLVRDVATGKITDGKTQVAILKTYLLLKE